MDDETLDLAVEAFKRVGLRAITDSSVESSADLVIDPESASVHVQLKRYSLVDATRARRVRAGQPERSEDGEPVLVVVGDRVTSEAREDLMKHRMGFIDLRGQMGVRTGRLVIYSSFEPMAETAAVIGALAGRAGMEVAAALLMGDRKRGGSIRELARRLDRSPSTVFGVLSRLREQRLIDASPSPPGTELFWALAARWGETRRQQLRNTPSADERTPTTRPLGLGLDDPEHSVGWALTDTAAAAVYGAPVAVQAEQVLDFLLPTVSAVRRAETLLGTPDARSQTRCSVRVSPVRAACERRVDLAGNYYEWPLAHPLFVALDLAQDLGRGREILDAWEPPGPWARVW